VVVLLQIRQMRAGSRAAFTHDDSTWATLVACSRRRASHPNDPLNCSSVFAASWRRATSNASCALNCSYTREASCRSRSRSVVKACFFSSN
jgi:hypothetical protein